MRNMDILKNKIQNRNWYWSRESIPCVERWMRLPGLIVRSRRGAHLAPHASGRYERGLRTDPSGVHGWHLMVSTSAANATTANAVVVGQRGPTRRTLHGHQFGWRHGDQAVAAVRACWKYKNRYYIIWFLQTSTYVSQVHNTYIF